MSAGLVLQVLVAGIATGAIYGLVATGFSLVYRLTSVLQFAHGDLVGASAFIGIVAAAGTGPVTAANVAVWRYALGALAAICVAALAGAALYRFALRPTIARAGALGWIGATAASSFAIQGALAAAFPREAYALPDPLPFSRWQPIHLPDGATLQARTLFVLGIGVLVALAARTLLERSTFGLAVTAIASEPVGAAASGLPVERLVTIAFGLAGALAAIAGIAGTPTGGAIGAQTGALLGLKGIAVAMLGGLVDPDRVFIAALGVGVLEEAVTNLSWLHLGPAWRDVVPLLLVLGWLALRAPHHAREVTE